MTYSVSNCRHLWHQHNLNSSKKMSHFNENKKTPEFKPEFRVGFSSKYRCVGGRYVSSHLSKLRPCQYCQRTTENKVKPLLTVKSRTPQVTKEYEIFCSPAEISMWTPKSQFSYQNIGALYYWNILWNLSHLHRAMSNFHTYEMAAGGLVQAK